jgi:Protein of unknown function (DUF3616)
VRCKTDIFWKLCLWIFWGCFLLPMAGRAELVINEILLNPPGSIDVPNEYIELRGTPNMIIPQGTYLVCVEGDTNSNPGTIQNVFDLSGRAVGGNGFLVLLQKTNAYSVHTNCLALANTDTGAGFGSGSTSSINHKGEAGQVDLENGSETFLLIQSVNSPPIGADIDSDNNGIPDGPVYASWTILDSVGILDNDGLGDIAYGAINFRRNPAALASGNVVSVSFTPSYIGRTGNTTGSSAAAWVASDSLGGTVPNWTLGPSTSTVPSNYGGMALNHIGAPNFGAPAIPGVVAWQTSDSTDVMEGSGTDSYAIGLPVAPAGQVTIQIIADGQIQVSTDNGATFGSTRNITFNSATPKVILVRALVDNVVDTVIHPVAIHHQITSSADPTKYPTSSVMPLVLVNVTETKGVILSELKVNPPGQLDGGYEFVELRGEPGLRLTNVYFVAVEGNLALDPGMANLVVNLSGARLGSSGLLVLGGYNYPHEIPLGTEFIPDARFDSPAGVLGNNTMSFLLLSSPKAIQEGSDLDDGNNGVLEGLAKGAAILDAVAWTDGDVGDVTYGGVLLTQGSGHPDAASRFDYNNTPLSAAAWYNGDLAGSNPDTLLYDPSGASANFPLGARLTPGIYANQPPSVAGLHPFSGVIGDPTNPGLKLELRDPDTAASDLRISVTSSNQAVVPNGNLSLVPAGGQYWTLFLNPIGVGYSWIRLVVQDDDLVVTQYFHYAASAMGRPGGQFYAGMSDASAAYPMDANYMWVADDENQTLKLYDRTRSGAPLLTANFDAFLGLTDLYDNGLPREVDLEGSTHVGNRLFWLGSHSLSGEAAPRPNRARLFATDFTGSGTNTTLTYRGRYDFLRDDLIAWDANNLHGKGPNYYGFAASTQPGVDPKAPDGSGFNIEGLCMAPGSSTTAYLGFRAPIVPAIDRNYALLVPVLNFTSLAGTNLPPGSAVFGSPIELDLYGRGIRSIEGSDAGILIVGGAPGATNRYPADFRLYRWTGISADQPQQLSPDLSGMNPEAIVETPPGPWSTNTLVQLLSDNGTAVYYNDDIEAKHLTDFEFKKFRGDWVTLGHVVKPAPFFKSIQVANGNLTVLWRSLKGETYRLQSKSNLASGGWSDIPGDITATGPAASKTFPVTGSPRFYRVFVLP